MYLKKIEMKGFKSFASPTVLEFGTGVNAIVGPNGSGKSNIIEAIRWALGEQSAKQLRGDKMQDVIFSGTQHRRAMNQAYVTLVIDNSDRKLAIQSDEVTITRRLNRQNESEFELNQQACRLKDITDLMTDSGIGKQSLSIISQGKVEEIFEQKPEQRRALFEEAAGILKYKQRKQETKKKLSETDEHLDRLEDVLYELERQLTPLESQAKTAKRYKVITEELSTLEISVNVCEIQKAVQEKEHLIERSKSLEHKERQQKDKVEQLKQTLEEQKGKYEQALNDLEADQDHYITINKALEKAQAKRSLIEERQVHQKESKEQLASQQLSIDSDLMGIVEQKAKISQSMIEGRQSKKRLEQQLQKVTRCLDTLEEVSSSSVEELREQYFEAMQEQATLNNELQALEVQFEKEQARKKRLSVDQQAWLDKLEHLKDERDSLIARQQKADDQLKRYKQEQATLQATLTHLEGKQNEKQKSGKKAQEQINRLEAQITSTKQLIESRAYYFQGTRSILENKQLTGIIGAVAEQIHVDPKFTTAIDIALGNRAQHLIVKDEKSAKEAIHYLKKEGKGQATFLPQTTIKPQSVEPRLKETLCTDEHFLGIASDLIETSKENQSIIQSLLGKTGIVTDLDTGLALAKKIQYQLKMVTLSGEIIQKGGALTGGSQVKAGNILQQKDILQQKEVQLQELKSTYATFNRKMQELSDEYQQVQEKKLEIDQLLQKAEIEYKQSTKLLESTEVQWKQYERENKFMEKELNQSMSEATYQQTREQLLAKKEVFEKEIISLQERTQAASQSVANRTSQKEEYLKQVYDLKSKLTVEKERLHQLTVEKERLMQEEEKLTARKQVLKEQQEALTEKGESWDLAAIEENIQSLTQEVEQKEHYISECRQITQTLKETVEKLEKDYQYSVQSFHRLELESHKIEERLKQMIQLLDDKLKLLSESYQLTYEKAEQQSIELKDMEKSRQRIRELKYEKQSLGSVNMEAMEQYETVKERFDTMNNQRNDLMTAKGQLLETIGEMDIKVSERFKETFEQISDSFSRLFPKMFGGGYAKISMTNPQDLLSTGIEIEVEPPGKKLKALSLLSGGERALTAITLLFAILEVKSVPFCILDEVEAALDEANVQRFGYYLKHFSTDQFIIITHRKGTMEMADALYGVTMEDAGISTLVSVKLEDYD